MRVSGGYIIVPSSLQVALPERPKDLGIDGPVISASRMAVLRPDWRALTARSEVTSDSVSYTHLTLPTILLV